MTSISDIAKRRFHPGFGLTLSMLLIAMTCHVLGQPAKTLEEKSRLRSVTCTFHLSPGEAKVWRRSSEGQRHFLGFAGEELHIGLNPAESAGRRDILVEFSVPLWGSEWRSEKLLLSASELAQSQRFPESGRFLLSLSRAERFQAFTRAHPKTSLSGLLLLLSALVLIVRSRGSGPETSESDSPTYGDYSLLELLGRGGMGEVYAALDREGNPCAVKQIRAELAEREGFRELFDREIATCLKLEHPNLVPLYAYGVTKDGQVYLVSKRLEGETLKERLSKKSYDPPRLAAEVLEQIGGALSYLHSRRHLHCDVKPSNIFIDVENKFWLMDLGVARCLSEANPEKVWGSPAYLAPEQEEGKPEYGSDQYSLGIVLFEILTGRRPFQDRDRTALRFHHKSTPPPSPRELEPRLSEEVESALLQMLEKRVTDRHSKLEEFRNSLSDSLFHLKW